MVIHLSVAKGYMWKLKYLVIRQVLMQILHERKIQSEEVEDRITSIFEVSNTHQTPINSTNIVGNQIETNM